MTVTRPTSGTVEHSRTQTASRFGESVVLAHVNALLTVRRSPVVLVAVATSFELVHALYCLSVSVIFWSNTSAISSRSRQNGLQYAVEGYIQNIKINNEGDTTVIEAKVYRSQKKMRNPTTSSLNAHSHNCGDY